MKRNVEREVERKVERDMREEDGAALHDAFEAMLGTAQEPPMLGVADAAVAGPPHPAAPRGAVGRGCAGGRGAGGLRRGRPAGYGLRPPATPSPAHSPTPEPTLTEPPTSTPGRRTPPAADAPTHTPGHSPRTSPDFPRGPRPLTAHAGRAVRRAIRRAGDPNGTSRRRSSPR
ncbi:hypothetical protein NKH77_30130 [Streptomyces sp. M19]